MPNGMPKMGLTISVVATMAVGAAVTVATGFYSPKYYKADSELKAKEVVKDSFHLNGAEIKKAEQMVKTDTITWEQILKSLRVNNAIKAVK